MLKGNERAGRFYERAGWRPDGRGTDDHHCGGLVCRGAIPARRVVTVAGRDDFDELYDEPTLGRLEAVNDDPFRPKSPAGGGAASEPA